MVNIDKIDGRLIAIEPISHIGESRGIDSKLARLKIRIKSKAGVEKVIEIPYISGNSVRGKLRRVAGYKLMDLLGIRKENLVEDLQHSIFSGGMLKKGAGNGILDTNFITNLRRNLPHISLFGTAIGQQLVQSKMDVGQPIPISCQTQHMTGVESETSIYSLIGEIAATRRDDMEDKPKGGQDPDEQKQQMRYTHEVLIPGTEFYHYFTLRNCNDLEKGAFWSTIAEFCKYPKLGGLECRGFGMVRLDYEIQHEAAKQYDEWVVQNKDSIIKYYNDSIIKYMHGLEGIA